MTFDFSKAEIDHAMAWFDLPPDVAPGARICCKPATEANPAYYNAMLKRAGRRVRNMIRSDRISLEDAALNREDDRSLYPRYVITNWDGLNDTDGKPVPFSRDHCVELCEKLPNWVFDQLRNFAATPERFITVEDEEEAPEPQELAGN